MKVAVAVPLLPSTTATSLIERPGWASSFVIVPTACASPIVPLTAFERLTLKVSLTSFSVSPLTSTVTWRVVWPAAKVTVPLPDW